MNHDRIKEAFGKLCISLGRLEKGLLVDNLDWSFVFGT